MRLWVQFPTSNTGQPFFALYCWKNCIVCLKKTENKRKRGMKWSIYLNIDQVRLTPSFKIEFLCSRFFAPQVNFVQTILSCRQCDRKIDIK